MPTREHLQKLASRKKIPLEKGILSRAEKFAASHVSSSAMREAFSVGRILIEFSPDQDTLIASILLKLAEIKNPPFDEIEKEFGESVADLLRSLQKLVLLAEVSLKKSGSRTTTLRKMFLALARDTRVVFLKLANRLYSLEQIKGKPSIKQKIYAKEVFELYGPISSRLGIYRLKRRLEDLAFQTLLPKEYHRISKKIEHTKSLRKGMLKKGEKVLMEILRRSNITGKVESRVKDPYSIYLKLKRKETSEIEDLNDLFAFRILVPQANDCYVVLGKIHQKWNVLPGRFKDYITVPKPNGYSSLHTSILSDFYKKAPYPIEIQIRTFQMHEDAEFGSAVHWHYKERGSHESANQSWFASLAKTNKKLNESKNFEIFVKDFLGDRIFVLTEKGDIKILPENSTPLDFAYSVHSDIGEHCQSAIVNGKIVPLRYTLQNGDIVKIATNRRVVPRESWLAVATAASTRQKIRAFLRQHDKEFFVREGKKMLNAALSNMGAKELDKKLSFLKGYETEKSRSLKSRESILQRIGVGDLSAQTVSKKLLSQNPPAQKKIVSSHKKKNRKKEDVLVAGEKGFYTKRAQCCSPAPGDLILAFITRTGTFTLHKRHCAVLKKLDPHRFLAARWTNDPVPLQVHLRIKKDPDHFGIIQEISRVFASLGVNLVQIHYSGTAVPGMTKKREIFVAIEVLKKQVIPQILKDLRDIMGIEDIQEISEKEIPYRNIQE